MLTRLGLPVLLWLDETALPAAYDQLDRFGDYIASWRHVLGLT